MKTPTEEYLIAEIKEMLKYSEVSKKAHGVTMAEWVKKYAKKFRDDWNVRHGIK